MIDQTLKSSDINIYIYIYIYIYILPFLHLQLSIWLIPRIAKLHICCRVINIHPAGSPHTCPATSLRVCLLSRGSELLHLVVCHCATAGIWARFAGLQIMSFIWLWRLCLGALFRHTKPCRSRASTAISNTHVCDTHARHASLWATETLMASSDNLSNLSPTDENDSDKYFIKRMCGNIATNTRRSCSRKRSRRHTDRSTFLRELFKWWKTYIVLNRTATRGLKWCSNAVRIIVGKRTFRCFRRWLDVSLVKLPVWRSS